jgi:HAD superfamily hydrolase (TIGR01490 family)
METTSSKNSSSKGYIAFFDLDKTLTGVISGRAIALRAFRKGLMKNYSFLQALLLSALYKLKLKDPLAAIDQMARWTKGMDEKIFIELCNEAVEELLIPSVYPDARKEILLHKANNARVVLLSSALTPVCRGMAENLVMDDYIGTEMKIKDNRLTGETEGELCYGNEKAVRLRQYCEKNNTTPASVWYYGDSFSDLQVLSAVGNPVCINPDRSLKKVARQRGWKTERWKN